jgi:hypothetical protein
MTTNNITQLLEEYKVVIPPIQRDYAHGRNTGKIPRIRERFLSSIYEALEKDSNNPMELDFVYGYTQKGITGNKEEVHSFKPLDGQQRLTTLFLLHWYIATKTGRLAEATPILKRFSYETRHSSRQFCEKLISFQPTDPILTIDKEIEYQPWFFSSWMSDPTVLSMLVVLKEIERQKFSEIPDCWEKLTGNNPRIVFHLLPMDDLGLPDDLYIKMNSRGKELTDFEYFKSQFSELLKGDRKKTFDEKIDKEWSDLFWKIFRNKDSDDIAQEVDSGFLSFFWFITDILIIKHDIPVDNDYWLNKIKTVYAQEKHVDFLFDCIKLFEKIEKTTPDYFNNLFYINDEDFDIQKTKLFYIRPNVNLFHKCAEAYGYEDKQNSFSVGEQLLLYAIIYTELNDKNNLAHNIRKLRNLFQSSEDQLRREYLGSFLYADVEKILNKGELTDISKLSKRQLKEEADKNQLIAEKPQLKECIYKLEDHTLLRGNIRLLGINEELQTYAPHFLKIFNSSVNFYEVSKVLLTLGDYMQDYGGLRRAGNKFFTTWRELFTQSEKRKGFEETSKILKNYLLLLIQNPSLSNADILNAYLNKHANSTDLPKDWKYYFIKYPNFLMWGKEHTNGFYSWSNFSQKPYEFYMMFRKQFNGRHWDPFLLEISTKNTKCTLDNYGNDLQYTNQELILMIKNFNNGFQFIANDELSINYLNKLVEDKYLSEEGVLLIKQNEYGLDLEDRIIKCISFLNNLEVTTKGRHD